MEYVEKLTLKEAIEDGESEVDSWKHMVRPARAHLSCSTSDKLRLPQFQILSAMLHFTSLKSVARLVPTCSR